MVLVKRRIRINEETEKVPMKQHNKHEQVKERNDCAGADLEGEEIQIGEAENVIAEKKLDTIIS
jgi:hypothetical protein